MAAIELRLDQRPDVDVVDDKSLHETGELDVDEEHSVHPHAGEVGLTEHGAAEVGRHEASHRGGRRRR